MEQPIAIVTGGAGFIGSHMVDLLVEKGYQVRVIDNLIGGRLRNIAAHLKTGNVTFKEIDIRDLEPTDDIFAGANYVFHFAGIGDIVPSIEKPSEYMDVNVQGTVRVLECARHWGVQKVVYAASSSCYGLASTPTDEAHEIAPQYPYALSKYQGEQAVLHWHKVYGLPTNSIRIFNAYGTRSRTSGAYGAVFGVFLRQKLAETPLTVVGDGTQSRDFIYATDVAAAFYAAADTEIAGEVFNVGCDKPQSVNTLVDLLGGDVVYVPRRPGEPAVTWANISKIRNTLDWTPQVSFEAGVARIVAEIDYWQEAPLWDPESIEKATQTWFKYLGE